MMKEEYRIYEEKMNKTLDSLQGICQCPRRPGQCPGAR